METGTAPYSSSSSSFLLSHLFAWRGARGAQVRVRVRARAACARGARRGSAQRRARARQNACARKGRRGAGSALLCVSVARVFQPRRASKMRARKNSALLMD